MNYSRIQELCKAHGISERKLAEEIGFKSSVVDDWRRGRSESFNKKLPEIASAFNLSLNDLVEFRDSGLNPDREQLLKLIRTLPDDKISKILTFIDMLE